jgi:hypothetical protein
LQTTNRPCQSVNRQLQIIFLFIFILSDHAAGQSGSRAERVRDGSSRCHPAFLFFNPAIVLPCYPVFLLHFG